MRRRDLTISLRFVCEEILGKRAKNCIRADKFSFYFRLIKISGKDFLANIFVIQKKILLRKKFIDFREKNIFNYLKVRSVNLILIFKSKLNHSLNFFGKIPFWIIKILASESFVGEYPLIAPEQSGLNSSMEYRIRRKKAHTEEKEKSQSLKNFNQHHL